MQVMKALGAGSTYLTIEFIKKALDIIILLITLRFGVVAITVGMVVSSCLAAIVNAWPNKKLIDYSVMDQTKDIFPNIVFSIIMALIVFAVGLLPLNKLLLLIVQILTGIFVYWLLSVLTKKREYEEIIGAIKSRRTIQKKR